VLCPTAIQFNQQRNQIAIDLDIAGCKLITERNVTFQD
jgi:hypothetical protein